MLTGRVGILLIHGHGGDIARRRPVGNQENQGDVDLQEDRHLGHIKPLPSLETLDVPYLPSVILAAAGLPLSDTYRERLRLMFALRRSLSRMPRDPRISSPANRLRHHRCLVNGLGAALSSRTSARPGSGVSTTQTCPIASPPMVRCCALKLSIRSVS